MTAQITAAAAIARIAQARAYLALAQAHLALTGKQEDK